MGRKVGGMGEKKQDLAVKSWKRSLGCPLDRPIREKITARLVKKARFGRKIGGDSLGSRENYGQNGRKSKIWP